MKEISVFDVIGPNMIGPSSSHTAGALKIALLARRLAVGKITAVRFILYGSFAKTYKGHGTDRALLGGILGFQTEDARIKDSFHYAELAGLAYSFETDETNQEVHPNTADIFLTTENGKTVFVRGVSTGGGACRIEKIDNFDVDLTGDLTTLLIKQQDTFGVVAYITNCLSEYEINIAFMRLYRESKGENAYTIIETDSDIPPQLVDKIKRRQEIYEAMVIKL
jgi:L-serine dehydratase, iron-sulfur-dependent, beta subunit